MKVVFGLNHQNVDFVRSEIAEISNPASPRFRQWLDHDAARRLTAPSAADVAAVSGVLAASGAHCSQVHASLECRMTVAQVEKTFNTRVSSFQHPEVGIGATLHRIHPQDSFTIPSEISSRVAFTSQVRDWEGSPQKSC